MRSNSSNSFFTSNNDQETSDSFEQAIANKINYQIKRINPRAFIQTLKQESGEKFNAPFEKNFGAEAFFNTVLTMGLWNMYHTAKSISRETTVIDPVCAKLEKRQ